MGPVSEAFPWYSWVGPIGEAHVILEIHLRPGRDRWVKVLESRFGYCKCFVRDYHFSGIRIGVFLCRGHRSKGSRVMNGFSFNDRSSLCDFILDWFYL